MKHFTIYCLLVWFLFVLFSVIEAFSWSVSNSDVAKHKHICLAGLLIKHLYVIYTTCQPCTIIYSSLILNTRARVINLTAFSFTFIICKISELWWQLLWEVYFIGPKWKAERKPKDWGKEILRNIQSKSARVMQAGAFGRGSALCPASWDIVYMQSHTTDFVWAWQDELHLYKLH